MDPKNLWKLLSDSLVIEPKTFSTGSTGFYAGGKVVLDNAKYQVSLSIVKVGSKPAK